MLFDIVGIGRDAQAAACGNTRRCDCRILGKPSDVMQSDRSRALVGALGR